MMVDFANNEYMRKYMRERYASDPIFRQKRINAELARRKNPIVHKRYLTYQTKYRAKLFAGKE